MQKIISHLEFLKEKIHFFQFITISLILGIIWQYNNYSFIPVTIGFLLLFFILIFFNKQNKLYVALQYITCIFIFFFGTVTYQKQQTNFNNFHSSVSNKTFDAIGIITDINYIEHLKLRNCLTFKIESLKEINNKKWQKTNHIVQIYVSKLYGLKIGDKVKINKINFTSSITDSFKNYLIKEGLHSSIFLYKFSFKKLSRPQFSVSRSINQLKNRIFYKLKSKMSNESFTFFSSIFLGNKNHVKNSMQDANEQFKIWGLSHYLARSGLHLIIVIALWHLLMSLLGLSFYFKHILEFLLIFSYHLLSWPSIPFVRSFFMFILYKICILSDLQINSLHLLNLTTFTILLFNPIQLIFLNFQLSFILTYALIWISNFSVSKKV